MAYVSKSSNDPSPFSPEAFDADRIPDFHYEFSHPEDIDAFRRALTAPEVSPVVALNDWRPVHQVVRKRSKRRRRTRRSKDETREGYFYVILKYPLLILVFAFILVLSCFYTLTRFYIYSYEHLAAWTEKGEKYRRRLRSVTSYADWIKAASNLDEYLDNDQWKEEDEYAYYDSSTVRKVKAHLKALREKAELEEKCETLDPRMPHAVDDLRSLVEACVKNNFCGIENPRLYSETYFGTKHLIQEFIEEAHASLDFLLNSTKLSAADKYDLSVRLDTQFGRTALCLSGGATFAYYHFGVIKALLNADLLPQVITGTSGGALVAALLGTRTNEELKELLVPALAHRITACEEGFTTWIQRWWRTGARFDSVAWAQKCSWFTRGSLTFREAYERTGRILNVTCVPSDPHSPTILTNYLTSPDCVIWSAVLASAAVPGILNPIVLMKKDRNGNLSPYSFGHKWKDGSLRTDIPLKALNLHFNVNFSVVSQVNPHINLFFFSSRGSVGRPVTHRRGRGWRGGFIGSAVEQYLKLDLTKWLKVLRHLELLPRLLGQDWSEIWLQRFDGNITIWPRTCTSDFVHILSDPTPERLATMIQVGQQSTFPRLKFLANRLKIERAVVQGLINASGTSIVRSDHRSIASRLESTVSQLSTLQGLSMSGSEASYVVDATKASSQSTTDTDESTDEDVSLSRDRQPVQGRRSSVLEEIRRQGRVFWDDSSARSNSESGGEESLLERIGGKKVRETVIG